MLLTRLRLSRLVRLFGSTWLACATLFLSAHSIAEERGFELTWQGPEECAERSRALSSVERLLGAPPEQLATPPLAVLASVASATSGEWRVRLVITREGTSRTRELRGHSCPELADAVALILALAIDPEVFSRSGGEAPKSPLAEAGKHAEGASGPEEHTATTKARVVSAPGNEPPPSAPHRLSLIHI